MPAQTVNNLSGAFALCASASKEKQSNAASKIVCTIAIFSIAPLRISNGSPVVRDARSYIQQDRTGAAFLCAGAGACAAARQPQCEPVAAQRLIRACVCLLTAEGNQTHRSA